jgi:hypothetical protein
MSNEKTIRVIILKDLSELFVRASGISTTDGLVMLWDDNNFIASFPQNEVLVISEDRIVKQ